MDKTGRFAKTYWSLLWIFPALCLLLAGCGIFGAEERQAPRRIKGLERIAVLPMDRASTKPLTDRPTCNISGGINVSASAYVPPEAAETLTSILFDKLGGDPRFIPVTQDVCLGFLASMLEKNPSSSELKLLQGFARDLKVDAVLYGKLYRFRERIGSEYSVKSPASVAFSLILVRARDGAVLWRYSFDQTQQSLTENLLNWRFYKEKGMRWVTAGELAAYGMEEAIKELKEILS